MGTYAALLGLGDPFAAFQQLYKAKMAAAIARGEDHPTLIDINLTLSKLCVATAAASHELVAVYRHRHVPSEMSQQEVPSERDILLAHQLEEQLLYLAHTFIEDASALSIL